MVLSNPLSKHPKHIFSSHCRKRQEKHFSSNVSQVHARCLQKKSDNSTSFKNYRESLEENGCAEIDIPKNIHSEIKKIQELIDFIGENTLMIRSGQLKSFKDSAMPQLSHNQYQSLNHSEKKIAEFLKSTIDAIFLPNYMTCKIVEDCLVTVRKDKKVENVFHQDYRISKWPKKVEITAIYPFGDAHGTAYIPYDKKHHYPEAKSGKPPLNEGYFYKGFSFPPEHIQYADPNKFFIFLCREASQSLGDDFKDKSLIHATPQQEGNGVRSILLGRFSVVDKNILKNLHLFTDEPQIFPKREWVE